VRSHSAGTGARLDDAIVRSVILAASSPADTGIRWMMCRCRHRRHRAFPDRDWRVRSGPLGIFAVLIGEGVARINGDIVPGAQALALAGWHPIELAPREAHAQRHAGTTALALANIRAERAAFVARMTPTYAWAATRHSTRAPRGAAR
jgi:histidine ammonia-lyase